jgi:hypothetical protein
MITVQQEAPPSQYDGHPSDSSTGTLERTIEPFLSPYLSHSIHSIHEGGQNDASGILIVDQNPIRNVLPSPPTRPKSLSHLQRARSHPHCTQGPEEISFPLDLDRQRLLEHILNTDWYRDDDPEPKLGNREANDILFCMDVLYDISFPSKHIKTGRSIYTLLTDPISYKCLMCSSVKGSAQRAVECVRAHIGHRPFRCLGKSLGCGVCRPGQE